MSQFIQIAIEDATNDINFAYMYALDNEGTIWVKYLGKPECPFEVFYRSVTEPKPKKERKAKAPKQPFDDWLTEIQQSPAYSHIVWKTELEKMRLWLKDRPGRQLTKKFVLNWVNKIETPISLESLATKVCPNRVRKEGKSFMRVCGEPAKREYHGKLYCEKCIWEIARRGK